MQFSFNYRARRFKIFSFIVILLMSACKDHSEDTNIPDNPTLKGRHANEEVEEYVREKTMDINSFRTGTILHLIESEIELDTVVNSSPILLSVPLFNLGTEPIKVQDILISDIHLMVKNKEFIIEAGGQEELQIQIEPKGLIGRSLFELIILNNSLDMEKKLRISGYFKDK